eukprot:TRINITY_DN8505_c0_g1_i1.p1 TRINITY_DN8505_c0_g1~~TRINITY_DN8505_c0_g1_i1.p1  ORF type:complete len:885 (-),score=239.13 TRINITY_DN8505_c0_g1_i1:28-2682(-)
MTALSPIQLASKLLVERGSEAPLDEDLLKQVISDIMTGNCQPIHIGAFLTALQARGVSPTILATFSQAMRGHGLPCEAEGVMDIVGTGGDGMDTFNVSTASAFIVAAAGGRVMKHGNRAASSQCGSADLLEALGARIDVDGTQAKYVLDHCGFCFLFAQKFHPCMRSVAPIRKQLGFRTVFNGLGPLINPVKPKYQMSGVYSESLGPLYIQTFKLLGVERGLVVHSSEGLDEISPAGVTQGWLLIDDTISPIQLTPELFGLSRHELREVVGGDPTFNKSIFYSLINNELQGAMLDFVLMNAGAAIYVAGLADSFAAGAALARSLIASGAVKKVAEDYIRLTNEVFANMVPQEEKTGHEGKEEKVQQQAESKAEIGQASTILQRIAAQRTIDVAQAKTPERLQQLLEECLSGRVPTLQPVMQRVQHEFPQVAVMAEIKRASPSKGDIAPDIDPVAQALSYARGGAAVISVLTEPKWFKGSIDDLRAVRAALQHVPNRPCVLLKDFVLEEYQLLEARALGADTALLIVALLPPTRLTQLIQYARSLGMEPLVEVNTEQEMKTAVSVGARFIGVNNRNLHNFAVDMATTDRLSALVPDHVILAALSGIQSRSDVEHYMGVGARAVLVGEALMKSSSPVVAVRKLRNLASPLVKICGVRDVATAQAAAAAGADFIGLVFAESKRRVDIETAAEISRALRGDRQPPTFALTLDQSRHFCALSSGLERMLADQRPLLVGVFMNQSLEEVQRIADQVPLDIIQLHGSEPVEMISRLNRPVIRALHVTLDASLDSVQAQLANADGASCVLLDTKVGAAVGGTGQVFDWSIASQLQQQFPLFLAGGLNLENVAHAVREVSPWAIDVSSGVETDGRKDFSKIISFVEIAKSQHS